MWGTKKNEPFSHYDKNILIKEKWKYSILTQAGITSLSQKYKILSFFFFFFCIQSPQDTTNMTVVPHSLTFHQSLLKTTFPSY